MQLHRTIFHSVADSWIIRNFFCLCCHIESHNRNGISNDAQQSTPHTHTHHTRNVHSACAGANCISSCIECMQMAEMSTLRWWSMNNRNAFNRIIPLVWRPIDRPTDRYEMQWWPMCRHNIAERRVTPYEYNNESPMHKALNRWLKRNYFLLRRPSISTISGPRLSEYEIQLQVWKL